MVLLMPQLSMLPAAEIMIITSDGLVLGHEYPAVGAAYGFQREGFSWLVRLLLDSQSVGLTDGEKQPDDEGNDEPEQQFDHEIGVQLGRG